MEYQFRQIEKKWQSYWAKHQTFQAEVQPDKPKFYVLDMFPYPSGAGLHVGHPLGYIASDIYARYKRLKGFNVLHPMGYDAFGLPAEQYAIQTGQHPAVTTEQNIKRYREQLDNIGFSFDWSKEVRTSDPLYYKWTQWIFIQLFHSWYNNETNKAEPISTLISKFEQNGNGGLKAVSDDTTFFSSSEWKSWDEKTQQDKLMQYRLAYLSMAMVNWCPALGTVLANDEVKDGVSERGGHPVERKYMPQWSMRITAYADRLLQGLEKLDWTESMKEAQRNWIGKSAGCSLTFKLEEGKTIEKGGIEVFTTRPDTIFGVSFLTLAPEHSWVADLTTPEQKEAVEAYVKMAKNRSERDRMADVKTISGVFTGSYVIHPFTLKKVPIWVGDYVLAGYGTGAVMGVPAHDSRDYRFARHFGLPILEVVAGGDLEKESYDAKEGKLINSDFLNGLEVKAAIAKAIEEIEKKGIGKGKITFRLRDAAFGRQRYWGEPIPIYYKDNIPYTLPESALPLVLPEVDKYLPTEDGEPPLARASKWDYNGYPLETTTMPGWAGSSWYFLRYMDVKNDKTFASHEAVSYWQDVDLYIGGSEHATGHLLYVRFWTKFLYDLGLIPKDEPAKMLINQGMIQGRSNFVYRLESSSSKSIYISYDLISKLQKNEITKADLIGLIRDQTGETVSEVTFTALHVDVNIVENDILSIEKFKTWSMGNKEARFVTENGQYVCGIEIEKMSKSKWNVVNPDDLIEKYGADTLRMYEMFLGPLELSKPWNTNGITGVYTFLRKFWKLFHMGEKFNISEEAASPVELKVLHRTIKKVQDDIERFSFNTSVSNFMICVNELTELKSNKRSILEPLTVLLSSYAPHISEELWQLLGHATSISFASYPVLEEKYLKDDSFDYPISINGKTRTKLNLSLTLNKEEVEQEVLNAEEVQKYTLGAVPKKIIVVPGRIVNIVI